MKALTFSTLLAGIFFSAHAQTIRWDKISAFTHAAAAVESIIFAEDKFVVAGKVILYSEDDAVTWHEARGLRPKLTYKSLAYGNGRFVAVTDTDLIATSDDGIYWTYTLHDGAA